MCREKGWPWNICCKLAPYIRERNIRVFVLYWDKSPPPVPAINGFPRSGKDTVRGLITCCCREWTFNGGRMIHLGSIFRYQNDEKGISQSKVWVWFKFDAMFHLCRSATVEQRGPERGRGCIIYCCHTIVAKEMLSKERRRKILPRIIRHNHWQTA